MMLKLTRTPGCSLADRVRIPNQPGTPAKGRDGMRALVPVLCLPLAFALPAAAGEEGRALPAVKEFVYHNPASFQDPGNTGELRDPAIIRVGDAYYLVFTVFPFTHHTDRDPAKPDWNSSPGIKLYRSTDLVRWEFVDWLVKSSELPEDCPYKHRFWAPELRRMNGKFHLTFTANNWIKEEHNPHGAFGMYAFVGVAERVEGPYEHITCIDGAGCDTSLFCDDDGRTYAYIPAMDVHVQEVDLARLHEGKAQLIGERKRVVTARNDDIGLDWSYKYLEGPWAFKRGDTYCLIFAGLRKDGHDGQSFDPGGGFEYWSGIAYAKSPMGPFAKDPRGKAFHGGHMVTFEGPDHRQWFSYRWEMDDSIRGRLCIDPLDFDQHGRYIPSTPSKGMVRIRYQEGSRHP